MASSERIVRLTGRLDKDQAAEVNQKLRTLADLSQDIITLMIVDCPGGEAEEGLLLHDTIQEITEKTPIIGVAQNMIASMAMVILQACTRRLIVAKTKVLVHPLIFEVQLPITKVSSVSLLKHFRRVVGWQKKIDQIFSERSGLPIKQVIELLGRAVQGQETDAIMSPSEAKGAGLVDEIIDSL